jgi:hypothetical protein
MNSNDFIQIRLEKIKKQLCKLPVLEDLESVTETLTIFDTMVKDLQIVYWVMYVRHKISDNKDFNDGQCYE